MTKLSLKKLLQKKDNKKLIGNFSSLLSIRLINIMQPLVVLPYLTKTLGPEMYGLVAFAQAFIIYFRFIINYGFNLSATRDISVNREDPMKVNSIFNNAFTAGILLAVLSYLILVPVVLLIPKFQSEWQLYILSSAILIGEVLFPIWYFQGIEKMQFISYLNIFVKVFFTILIFLFIHEKEDYLYVPFLLGLGHAIAGIIAILIIVTKFRVKFRIAPLKDVFRILKEGNAAFISIYTPNLYIASSTFFMGLFTNNTITGYYSATTKITDYFTTVIRIVGQTFFPHVSKKKKAYPKFILIILLAGSIFTIFVLAARGLLVNLLLSDEFKIVKTYLLLLSFNIFITAFNIGFGRNFLLTIMKDKLLRNINIIISLLGVGIIYLGVSLFQVWGGITAMVLTRLIFSIVYIIYYQKYKSKLQ